MPLQPSEVAEQVYRAYPRHKDKRFALLSIGRALQRIASGETGKQMTWAEAGDYLLARVVAFAGSPAGQRGTMTAYPATWMNRGSYMDDEREWEQLTPQEYQQARMQAEACVGVWRPQ